MIKTKDLVGVIEDILKEIELPFPFYPFCDLVAMRLNRKALNHYTRQFIRSYLESMGYKIKRGIFRNKSRICIIREGV